MSTSDENIETLVKGIIETQVITALNNAPEAVEKLVKAALSKPVDSLGKFDGYGTKMPYLDWLVGDEIRRAAEAAVRKIVNESSGMIEQKVREGLTQDTIVSAIVKSFVGVAESSWKINVSFAADKEPKYD